MASLKCMGVVLTGCEFPEEEAKNVIAKLGSVIQYLHSRFICVSSCYSFRRFGFDATHTLSSLWQHRDLKLENILLDAEDQGGTVKLCE